MKHCMVGCVALALLLGEVQQGKAGVITFEGHLPTNDGSSVAIQDGFRFAFQAEGWGIFEDSFIGGGAPWTQNGTTRLVASGGSPQANVTIEAVDGSAFSITGLDAATMFPGFTGGISLFGHLAGGGDVTASFALTDQFTTINLPSTFTGLTSLLVQDNFTGHYRQEPGFSLDNLQINTSASATPEPASLTLLCLGAVGTAGYAWRRRKAAPAA